jgi:peroxiredoxin
MPPALGSIAPGFTLKTLQGDELRNVSLSDYRGKENVVLLFIPAAFTHVCTAEFCDVSGGLADYKALDAVVLGISVDSPYAQRAWARQERIELTLLSDYQHDVTRSYDVVWPNFSGLGPCSARAVVVIDKNGVVRHTEQTPTLLDMPDLGKIKQVLAGLAA